MNYLYLGLTDYYLPAAAASLHLKQLNWDAPPSPLKLCELPYFRAVTKADEGVIRYVGLTEDGEQIYLTTVKKYPEIFVRGIHSLLSIYQVPLSELVIITCVLENPQVAGWCCFLQRIGWHSAAQQLGTRLVRNRLADLKKLVPHFKTIPCP
ncbi:MAG TPA: DUF3189 family protein [Oscillospiraceae bacterium]|nr:DUF3189 family protein [Oscillospiraceae bacterium]